jgi:predicted short-subunit dehydrogenase-like oxidoreductase (DUF2520 family)
LELLARPSAATGVSHPPPPQPPYDVVVVGAGRVGGSFARALERAGHRILGELHRDDDPTVIARADVVVLAVPDDALREAAGMVARLGRSGAVVLHSCGLHGIEPIGDCGPHVAAIHPACPVASNDQSLDGATFAVTAPDHLRAWCEAFVEDLGGRALFIDEHARPLYHAALVMASNFPVALVGDAAEVLGGHEVLMPLLRAMVDNMKRLGPDAALTGPFVRGDAGTVRAHLDALPPHLTEVYIAGARRSVARARAAGRITEEQARALGAVLDEGGSA